MADLDGTGATRASALTPLSDAMLKRLAWLDLSDVQEVFARGIDAGSPLEHSHRTSAPDLGSVHVRPLFAFDESVRAALSEVDEHRRYATQYQCETFLSSGQRISHHRKPKERHAEAAVLVQFFRPV